MRNEAVRRFAIVLVPLEQDGAVLDHQQPGDALVRQKILERPGLVFEAVAELDLGCSLGQRQRRLCFVERIMREYLVEMAERSHPHAFIEEPVGAGADRVTLALPNSSSSGAAKAGNASIATKHARKKRTGRIGWLPLRNHRTPIALQWPAPTSRAN